MRAPWAVTACALVVLSGCASVPRDRALRDCQRQIADEMGYDIRPDGSWAKRFGTQVEYRVQGAGLRIDRCLRARGY